MALIMSIEMDQAGIIEAIKIEAAKSVATPAGKVMVVELVAVRKPTAGYAANITFEDLPEEDAPEQGQSAPSKPVKRAASKAGRKAQETKETPEKVVEKTVEQTAMDAASDPDLDTSSDDADKTDVVVDDLDLDGDGDEELDTADVDLPTETKPFDNGGVEDADDVFA